MELADPLGWLVGSVTPTVRKPVATLRAWRGAPRSDRAESRSALDERRACETSGQGTYLGIVTLG